MCVVKLSSVKNKEFSFAFKNKNKLPPSGLSFRGSYMSLYAIKNEPSKHIYTIKLGIAISKRNGKAAKRNKIKRRLRAIVRCIILNRCTILNTNNTNAGYYYIIVTHRNIMGASYKNLQKDLSICFKYVFINKSNHNKNRPHFEETSKRLL